MRANRIPGMFLVVSLLGALLPQWVSAQVDIARGIHGVSPMGAATYRIPLEFSAQSGQASISLALVYDSQAVHDERINEGISGAWLSPGWSLSGLSSIKLCRSTLAQNGQTSSAYDKFCLNKNQLVLQSGVYGQAGSTYRTELDVFAQFTAVNSVGGGPQSFVVKTRDGLIYRYGNAASARVQPYGSGPVTEWLLDKVEDRSGNSVTVNYQNGKPQNIVGHNDTITFAYTYGAGLLNFVAAASRGYQLDYAPSPTTQVPRVTAVKQCYPSAVCGPPTQIGYQNGQIGMQSAVHIATGPILETRTADVDGDGKEELLYATQEGGQVRWWLRFHSGAVVNTGILTPGLQWLLAEDFLGVGSMQLLALSSGVWNAYKWTGASLSTVPLTLPAETYPSNGLVSPDIDADGRYDLVWVDADGWIHSRLNQSTAGTILFGPKVSTYLEAGLSTPEWKHLRPLGRVRPDFDGDSRGDVLAIVGSTEWFFDEECYINTGSFEQCFYETSTSWTATLFSRPNGTFEVALDSWSPGLSTSAYQSYGWPGSSATGTSFSGYVAYADWNHDGQIDGLTRDGSVLRWHPLQNPNQSTSTGVASGLYDSWTVLDHDGDGQYDLARIGSNGLSVHLHNAPGQQTDVVKTITDGYGIAVTFDYVSTAQGSYSRTWSGVADASYPLREYTKPTYVVSQITASDGIGGSYQQTLHYAAAREELRGRGLSGFAIRRVHDSRTGFYSVEKRRMQFPFTGLVESAGVYRSNLVTPMTLLTNTPVANPLTAANTYFPYVAQSVTQRYRYEPSGPQDAQLLDTNTTDLVFDAYGNLTYRKNTLTDHVTGLPWNTGLPWLTEITNVMRIEPSEWCVGLSERTTVRRTLPDGSVQESVTENELDTDLTKCRLKRATVEPDGDAALRADLTWTYHSCGAVHTQTVAGRDSNGAALSLPRVTTFAYAPGNPAYPTPQVCGALLSVTNAFGQTYTKEEYETLSQSTDANGVTRSLLTQLGRPLIESRGDNTSTQWTYLLCNVGNQYCGSNISDVRWSMIQDEFDGPNGVATASLTYTSRRVWYDGFDRVRRSASPTSTGGWTYVDATYDALGRVRTVSNPYSAVNNGFTRYHYDAVGRRTLVELIRPDGVTVDRQSSVTYVGRQVSVTDAKGHTTYRTFDATGALRQVQDPSPGGMTRYDYTYSGNKRIDTVTDPLSNITAVTTNVRGFKVSQTEMNLGTVATRYNSLGEVESVTDAGNHTTSYQYDLLGRMTKRIEPEGETTFKWGSSFVEHNIGKLKSVTSPGGYAEHYEYDEIGRAKTVTYAYAGEGDFKYDYGYDLFGRLHTLMYPQSTGSRFTVEYLYANGHLTQVKELNGQAFWTLNAQDEGARPIDEVLGNGVRIVSGFDPLTGLMDYRQSGNGGSSANLQDFAFEWDLNGNLTERRSIGQSLQENFQYDALNRLTQATVAGQAPVNFGYNAIGNIESKTGVGTYTYDPTKRNAVTSAGGIQYGYDADGNMTSRNNGTINVQWTSYNYPTHISDGSSYSNFFYGARRNRFKQVASYNGAPETTIYAGGLFEKVAVTSGTIYRHYIQAGSTKVVYTRGATSTDVYYVTTDHLSSTAMVTGPTGGLVVRTSFDAWGKRRNGASWVGSPPVSDLQSIAYVSRRGFTGHEHLDNLNLIHMNGRVYDPNIARFLSADPHVTDPTYSQSFNRYSYVWNNPLRLIDPTGFDSSPCIAGVEMTAGSCDLNIIRPAPPGTCDGVAIDHEGRAVPLCDGPRDPPPDPRYTGPHSPPPDGPERYDLDSDGGDFSPPSQCERKVNYVRLGAGVLGVIGGAGMYITGTASGLFGVGLMLTPGGQLPGAGAIGLGVLGMSYGAGSVYDGLGNIASAFDGMERPNAGAAFGGKIGGEDWSIRLGYLWSFIDLSHGGARSAAEAVNNRSLRDAVDGLGEVAEQTPADLGCVNQQ